MHWVYAAAAAIVFAELLFRLPLLTILGKVRAVAGKAISVVRSSRVSDHWKERALPRYALGLFGLTMALAGCLLLLFSPLALFAIFPQLAESELYRFGGSLTGVFYMSVLAVLYGVLRSHRAKHRL